VDIILVPGLWLDASSWERVVPALEAAGHRAHPLTLPGMESRDADRSGVGLREHVDAVVAAIDACGPEKVLLVGHSAGCGVCHAAVDARPDRVARAVYVGGFPTGDGGTLADGFPVRADDLPLPDWSEFGLEDLTDLDEGALEGFRARAVPSPARLVLDRQRLSDERRYDVPVTAVATEYTTETLLAWIRSGAEPVQEFARLKVDHVDLPTGHWPQLTRPDDLARVILDAAARV